MTFDPYYNPAIKAARSILLAGMTVSLRDFDASQFHPDGPFPYDLRLPVDLHKAVAGRQAEFISGRVAACDAMRALNHPPVMLPVGKHREPVWPPDISGSISHTGSLAVSVADMKARTPMLGIDIESLLNEPQAQELLNAVTTVQDRIWLKRTGLNIRQFVTLAFSAKESLFKAVFPYVRRYLEFSDAEIVEWDEASRRVTFTLNTATGREPLHYWADYLWDGELVITLVRQESLS